MTQRDDDLHPGMLEIVEIKAGFSSMQLIPPSSAKPKLADVAEIGPGVLRRRKIRS